MKLGKLRNTLLAGAALLLSSAAPLQAATTADILFVVDESGSMGGEHTWIPNMVSALDTALIGAGVTGNQYALIGYGGRDATDQVAHTHTVGGGDYGTATELGTSALGLVTSGGLEDGYQAIDYAFNNYGFRTDAAINVILITDEDRDINGSTAGGNTSGNSISYNDILNLLNNKNALLNAVVNATFEDGATDSALGIDSNNDAYLADGSGGFTETTGGIATGGYYNTVADYVNLALASGGAAWDLNKLRAGGDIATSFTAAFVDIKVKEIIVQPPSEVPLPAAAFMFAPALLGFLGLRRRAKASVA